MTEEFSTIELDHLVEIYMYANTPRYLYKHFRNSSAVQRLTTQHSPRELIDIFRRIILYESLSLRAVVSAYAVLMGLSFYEYKDTAYLLENIDSSHLVWGDEITDLIVERAVVTSMHQARFEPIKAEESRIRSSTTNRNNEISFKT